MQGFRASSRLTLPAIIRVRPLLLHLFAFLPDAADQRYGSVPTASFRVQSRRKRRLLDRGFIPRDSFRAFDHVPEIEWPDPFCITRHHVFVPAQNHLP